MLFYAVPMMERHMKKQGKKIAYIGQKGIPARWGGVERATEELATRMARNGYQVTAYCRPWYTIETPVLHKGVRLVYAPSIHSKHLDAITHTFVSLMHALYEGADIIHFQGIGPALLAWIPRVVAPHTRVLVTFHCLDRRLSKWNAFARFAFWCGEYIATRAAHELFVTSRFLQDYCYQVWGRVATYLPNGVFEVEAAADEARAVLMAYQLEPYQYVISVGRMMIDKAQHELIESFIRMKARGGDGLAHVKLVLVGNDTNQYAQALREQAAGRADIVFVGVQTGMALKTLMRYARAAAQPSYSEGMPLAVLEIASFGVPLVLSDIPAHREIFGDAHSYNPVGDIDRMSRDLERTLTHYEEMRPVALAQARRIQEQYRWEVIAARYHVALVSHGANKMILQGQGLLGHVGA